MALGMALVRPRVGGSHVAYLSAHPTMYLGPTTTVDRSREGAQERALSDVVDAAQVGERARHAVLLGSSDPNVCSLLTDVLRDIHLEVKLGSEEVTSADAVLAMIERVESVQVIGEARARFGRAPIVAILPLGTHRLATRAIAA